MTASLYQSAGGADAAARGDVASGRGVVARAVCPALLLPFASPTDRPALATTSPPLDLAARCSAVAAARADSPVPFKGTSLPFTSGEVRTARFTRGCFIARSRR